VRNRKETRIPWKKGPTDKNSLKRVSGVENWQTHRKSRRKKERLRKEIG